MRARLLPPGLALAGSLLAACAAGTSGGQGEQVREIATNVLTLQQGTVSELRARRGSGRQVTYDLPPDRMLEVLEEAAKRTRGEGGPPWVEVYVSRRYGEVIAKEFAEAGSDYEDAFRSAGMAFVSPLEGRPGASRVEIHGIQRGPFHRGRVVWERAWPAWVDVVLRERGARGL